jgi:hypothetical protein
VRRRNTLRGTPPGCRLYGGLYLTIVFLFVRNIYRMVEFSQSTTISFPPPPGTYIIAEQEALFYAMDTLMMLLCLAVLVVLHPGFSLRPRGKAGAAGGAVPGAAAPQEQEQSEAGLGANLEEGAAELA